MQVISHMDSLDNHRVRGDTLGGMAGSCPSRAWHSHLNTEWVRGLST